MKKYIRSERANLFEPNVYISIVVKLFGNLSSKEIEQAVYNAYKANESTMSKIVLEPDGSAYYEKCKTSGCKFITNNKPWNQLLCESEKTPFELDKGELVRVFLTKEKDQPILFIHAHHLVGDGKSVLILLNDIIKSLNTEPLTYKPMLSVNREFLEEKAKLPILTKLYIKSVNRKWKKNNISFTWNDYYSIHKKYWNNHTSDIQLKNYNPKELKSKCPENVSINSYLITELLKENPEYKVVGIPVSIREDNSMSNQVSGITATYKYNFKKPFAVNAKLLHKVIYKKLNSNLMKYFILLFMEQLCPSLTDAVLLQSHGCFNNKHIEAMTKVMGYTGNSGRDLGVTNLNIIDIQNKYEQFAIEDIYFIPPKVSYAKNVVGISTYNNKLTLCHHNMKTIS